MDSKSMSGMLGRVFNGRYRVDRFVGAGSMGDVYEGLRLSDDLTIAIKVLKPELSGSEVFRHRFLREAKSTVRINHPNVVDVMDFGEAEGGWLYIVMEFLEGEDLAAYLKRIKRLTWRQSCNLLQQAASGLAAAHEQGVVHRDVKPSNILLVDDKAGGARVKIVDFGVAKMAGKAVSKVLTAVDDVIGTVSYMSPEQAEGGEATYQSDIYSLGITAYELATGATPFTGRDMFQVLYGHLEKPPTPPAQLVPDFPVAANAFILRCLAKKPHARYASMNEVLQVLRTTASADAPLPPPQTQVGPAPTAESPSASSSFNAIGDGEFEEAPTGYFFRPVPAPAGSTPSRLGATALPSGAATSHPGAATPHPGAATSHPGASASHHGAVAGSSGPFGPASTEIYPSSGEFSSSGDQVPVPPGYPSPALTPRMTPIVPRPPQSLPGGTVRMPSVESPVVPDDDDDLRPAGQMSPVAVFLIAMAVVSVLAVGLWLIVRQGG